MFRIWFIVLFFTALFVPSVANACVGKSDTGKQVVVMFINGIKNTETESCNSSDLLRNTLIENGMSTSDFDYRYFYNPTSDDTLGDYAELRTQAEISDTARHQLGDYYFNLGQIYARHIAHGYRNTSEVEIYGTAGDLYNNLKSAVLSGKNIIVVAHSQGNYLSEIAYALFIYHGERDIVSHIRFVGVAVTASTTPNNSYVSLAQDVALDAHREQTLNLKDFAPLPSNVSACVKQANQNVCDQTKSTFRYDWARHGFDFYLNPNIIDTKSTRPISGLVSDLVTSARAELVLVGAYSQRGVIVTPPKPTTNTSRAGYEVTMAGRWLPGLFGILLRADKGTAPAEEYAWDFGDGKFATSKYPTTTHNYHDDGVYRIRLTVTYRTGETAVCTKTFVMDDDFTKRKYDRIQIPCE